MNQFAKGIQDRIVRSEVKRYIAENETSEICSMNILETASDAAREHAVEEQYSHTYRESVKFGNKGVEEKVVKLKVSNVNPQSQRPEHLSPRESVQRESQLQQTATNERLP